MAGATIRRSADEPWTVLVAPDSFKGSLTSVQVAMALADGWRRVRPTDDVRLCPLADGGEGTLEAIAAAGGWAWQRADVTDPLGRRIAARWLLAEDGTRAAVEMAEASGLSRVEPELRDPVGSTSIGTGELLAAAVDTGVTSIVLGIGGSATTDGGQGLLAGLVETMPRLAGIDLEVACDVDNPLLGGRGAAAVYGPQKGASPKDVADLDERNARWADELDERTGRSERETPGAGAAGGVGYALLSIQDRFHSFALRPGVDLLMAAAGFDRHLADADLVLTGEGRIDAQTGYGKTALGVAKRAQAAGIPCVAVGGGVEVDGIAALATVGAVAVPIVERPQSVEEAMSAGLAPIVRCAERVARLVTLVD